MSLAAFLQGIVCVLKEAGTPFMVTGSLAGAYYGQPRATQHVETWSLNSVPISCTGWFTCS